jgi:hypothetical protein
VTKIRIVPPVNFAVHSSHCKPLSPHYAGVDV